MTDKYQNKYRIPSARLRSWDYSSNAAYFITICTAKREHYFGQITNGIMDLFEQGKKANQYWLEIPDHFAFAFLDEFVVMPNHIHGIIIIDKPGNNDIDNVKENDPIGNFGVPNVSDVSVVETGHALSLQQSQQQPHPRFRNQGKNTISSMIGSFKSAVTKWCNENNLPFGWQSRFHDHIIRDNDEFHRIKNYIINNPVNWMQNKFFKPDS